VEAFIAMYRELSTGWGFFCCLVVSGGMFSGHIMGHFLDVSGFF
jgi:hypothetical protein